ncbi:MAG: hypothetical protein ACE5FD_13535, partial [Anaerolineae bacterium]
KTFKHCCLARLHDVKKGTPLSRAGSLRYPALATLTLDMLPKNLIGDDEKDEGNASKSRCNQVWQTLSRLFPDKATGHILKHPSQLSLW